MCMLPQFKRREKKKWAPPTTVSSGRPTPCSWRPHSLSSAPAPHPRSGQPSFYPCILGQTLCKKQTHGKHLLKQNTSFETHTRPPGSPFQRSPTGHSDPLRKLTKFQQLLSLQNKLQSFQTSKELPKAERGSWKRRFFTKVLAYTRGGQGDVGSGRGPVLLSPGLTSPKRTERPERSLPVKSVCDGSVLRGGRTEDPGVMRAEGCTGGLQVTGEPRS